jgi:uncharacterized protein YsxB (DUF464 family)
MIKNRGKSFEIESKGHAGYGEKGKDIVCSAVSILLYTLVDSIDERDLLLPPVVFFEEGNTFISLHPKEEKRQKICGILRVIANGFELLQTNFKKNVFFRWVGVIE